MTQQISWNPVWYNYSYVKIIHLKNAYFSPSKKNTLVFCCDQVFLANLMGFWVVYFAQEEGYFSQLQNVCGKFKSPNLDTCIFIRPWHWSHSQMQTSAFTVWLSGFCLCHIYGGNSFIYVKENTKSATCICYIPLKSLAVETYGKKN